MASVEKKDVLVIPETLFSGPCNAFYRDIFSGYLWALLPASQSRCPRRATAAPSIFL